MSNPLQPEGHEMQDYPGDFDTCDYCREPIVFNSATEVHFAPSGRMMCSLACLEADADQDAAAMEAQRAELLAWDDAELARRRSLGYLGHLRAWFKDGSIRWANPIRRDYWFRMAGDDDEQRVNYYEGSWYRDPSVSGGWRYDESEG